MKDGINLLRQAWCFGLLLISLGTAHAQAEFSYQAVLDLSYGRFEPSGFYREHRFNSNSLSASFVGGTAKYGFDDGWASGITLETFLRFQDMKTGRRDSDPFFSRNAFAFVNSKYGNVRVGRLQTFLFDTTTRFNALGNSVAFSPALRQVFVAGNLIGAQGDFYWDQAISYSSPNFDGLTGNLMYAKGDSAERGDYGAASAVWAYGLFAATASVQSVHIDDGIKDPTDEKLWQLGATYNFGFARVFGLYNQTRDKGLDVNSKSSSIGASAVLGPGSLLVQMGLSKATGLAVDRKQTTVSAAYVYPYDSQTDIYIIGMDDRVRDQTRGFSMAVGIRLKL